MKISLEFNNTKELDEFIIERSQELFKLCKLGKYENCRNCCEPEITEKVEVEAKTKRKLRKKKEEKATDVTETTESATVSENDIPTKTVDMGTEVEETVEECSQEEPETESTVEISTENSTEEQDLTDKPLLAQAKAEKAKHESEAKAQEETVEKDVEPESSPSTPEKERVAVSIEKMNDVVAFIRGHAGQINTNDMRKHMGDFAQWVTNQLPVLSQIKFEDEMLVKINELLAQD